MFLWSVRDGTCRLPCFGMLWWILICAAVICKISTCNNWEGLQNNPMKYRVAITIVGYVGPFENYYSMLGPSQICFFDSLFPGSHDFDFTVNKCQQNNNNRYDIPCQSLPCLWVSGNIMAPQNPIISQGQTVKATLAVSVDARPSEVRQCYFIPID